jgi:glycosyltransferase involved in cell wall biosynthesis
LQSIDLQILILSYYYPPDLSAGSFRANLLVKELLSRLPQDSQIEVVTTQPNRYHSHAAAAPEEEKIGNLIIRRIAVTSHKSGFLDQSLSFAAYARGVLAICRGRKYDLVIGTSSRLMTAALSASIAEKVKAPLYLDVRDLFVDTIADVLPEKVAKPLTKIFSLVESWTFSRAAKINLVSEGFRPYFEERYPSAECSFFSNCVDSTGLPTKQTVGSSVHAREPVRILYAGNIGEGQGLEKVIVELSNRLGPSVEFSIVGDGGRKDRLQESLAKCQHANVKLFPAMDRRELAYRYLEADVLFLHLNDYRAFQKVLPSKIFEYAAMGKPIWAGVSGYAASFISREVQNAEIFAPCDIEGAVDAFQRLSLTYTDRTTFTERFSCAKVIGKLAEDILATAHQHREIGANT